MISQEKLEEKKEAIYDNNIHKLFVGFYSGPIDIDTPYFLVLNGKHEEFETYEKLEIKVDSYIEEYGLS